MHFVVALVALLFCVQSVSAQSFQSMSTQLKKKTIYARAAGEVEQVNLRDNQVFGGASVFPARHCTC